MEALIKIVRDTYTDKSTIGKLYVNDKFVCDTLEDVSRDLNRDGDLKDHGEIKVFGRTAIPAGRYKAIINISPRFGKLLPRLLNIPGFEGVLIHNGNIPEHSHGCFLVGVRSKKKDFVGSSVLTLGKLMGELSKFDTYTVEVVDTPLVN